MTTPLENLLDELDLETISKGLFEAAGRSDEGDHLFGGLVVAQSLIASNRVSESWLPHSMHAHFLRRGHPRHAIQFSVAELRRSRAFQTQRVTASQEGRPILEMTVSYHDLESGPCHQIPMDDVGPPEGEVFEQGLSRAITPAGQPLAEPSFELPVEIRGVGGLALFSTEVKPPNVRCWMRMRGSLPDDPALHQILFAYASDYVIMAPAVHPHPTPVTDFQSASLDHAIWFHRDFRIDEWLLFELDSPVATGARGLGRGLLYTRQGKLVASCVQEGLLRPLEARP